MRSLADGDALLVWLFNATLIASIAMLPALVAGYAICTSRARRTTPDFTLGKLETIELDRAMLLYERVCERLQDLQRECSELGAGFLARYKARRKRKQQISDEEKDLEAYAVHLRSTIVQLRARPFQRAKSWLHLASSQVAFSCCLLLYAAIFCACMAVVDFSQLSGWAPDIRFSLDNLTTWRPLDDRWFYANWFAANVAPIALPMLYCIRRAALRSKHELMLRDLEAFAGTDPDKLIPFAWHHESEEKPTGSTDQAAAPPPAANETWSDVLGLSSSAGLEEIKTAYKALIKQNHPDRVYDMAPLIRELAENETKRINAAYQEALLAAKPEPPRIASD